MQVMSNNNKLDISSIAYAAMDYKQNSLISDFAADLNNALGTSVYEEEYSLDDDDDYDVNNDYDPYSSTQTENFSPFAPQPVRMISSEINDLTEKMMKDDIGTEAINTLKSLSERVGGVSVEELITELEAISQGGNVTLNDKEIALLQSLSHKLSPQNPDALYDTLRFGSSQQGLEALTDAMKTFSTNSPLTLNSDELAAIGKVLDLDTANIVGLMNKGQELNAQNGIDPSGVDALFGNVGAVIDDKVRQGKNLEASLNTHLKTVVENAEKRETAEMQAQLRESKSVNQAKILMDETATTKALGEQLNRQNLAGESASDKSRDVNKSENSAQVKDTQKDNQALMQDLQAKTQVKEIETYLLEEKSLNNNYDEKFLNNAKENFTFNKSVLDGKQNEQASLERNEQFLGKDLTTTVSSSAVASQGNATSREGFGQSGQNSKREQNLAQGEKTSNSSEIKANSASSQINGANVTNGAGFDVANFGKNAQNVKSSQTSSQTDSASTLGNQVQSSLLSMAKNGTQSLAVSLNTAEMGQLQLSLTMKNGEMQAVVRAEKAESASMINMQLDHIKAELENQGFKIENIEVEVGLSQDYAQGENSSRSDNYFNADSHNSQREVFENVQYLDRLRNLTKLNASDTASLARNMQSNNRTAGQMENNSYNSQKGLYIVT